MKTRFDLLPARAITEVAEILTLGEAKHPERGWLERTVTEEVQAALRHFYAHLRGEKINPEWGRRHWAHGVSRSLTALELMLQIARSTEGEVCNLAMGLSGAGRRCVREPRHPGPCLSEACGHALPNQLYPEVRCTRPVGHKGECAA